MTSVRHTTFVALVAAVTALSACSGEQVVDRTVDSTLWVGKTAVKGTVGAGKMVVRGTGRALGSSEG